ncbi:MAG: pseudouridine synthase [Bacteroidetes bacterium]|nr:pseudouridine synthase [Bacteroidota bacterium]
MEKKKQAVVHSENTNVNNDDIRLNKYISNSGICSRRDADILIRNGKVTVNGQPAIELGQKVKRGDIVTVNGKKINITKHVYVLLNKPKDYITTTSDEQNRKTVLDLVKAATKERIYPVGRLDRNTTGVLLLTNDGDLTKILTHPSSNIEKIYAVTLNKPVLADDLVKLLSGIELEDGISTFGEVAYTDPKNKAEVGVKIHSGKNRIIRRMFEALGYDVEKLDRVVFANLTKKDLPRGKWRVLNDKEVDYLNKLAKR